MFSTRTSCATAAFLLALSRHVRAGAIIGDGEVILGIRNCAALNERYTSGHLPKTDPTGMNYVGIRNKNVHSGFGVGEITGVERGCKCEGWSVQGFKSDSTYDWCGDNASQGGPFNINACKQSFDSDMRTFSSVAPCMTEKEQTAFTVIHRFLPSTVPELYKVEVEISNTSETYESVQYRRTFDWDIDPSPFNEFVTHSGAEKCPAVTFAVDNGFCQQDPNLACNQLYASGDFVDVGPYDHGSTFQVNLGTLRPKSKILFTFYYGLSPGKCDGWISPENAMLQALQDVGANVYSLGQKNTNPLVGEPFTFAFGFACPKTPKVEYPFKKAKIDKDDITWADPPLGAKYLGDDGAWLTCRRAKEVSEEACAETITKLKCPETCAKLCKDDPDFRYTFGTRALSCADISEVGSEIDLCEIVDVRANCLQTCGVCGKCEDNKKFKIIGLEKKMKCKALKKKKDKIKEYCLESIGKIGKENVPVAKGCCASCRDALKPIKEKPVEK